MSADKELKAYIDRVLRLKEEQDELGRDIRDIYAEAKASGYDKTIMGKLVAHLRKVLKEGDGAVTEQENVFDTYLQAYQRASGMQIATHAHEEFDPTTGEFKTKSTAARIGRAGTEAVDTVRSGKGSLRREPIGPESLNDGTVSGQATASEYQASPVDTPSKSDDDAIAAVNRNAGLANVTDIEPSSSGQIATASQGEAEAHSLGRVSPQATSATTGSADANTGGDHVTDHQSFAAQAGASVQVAPAKLLRPHCRTPKMCGSGTIDHCHSCKISMREREVA